MGTQKSPVYFKIEKILDDHLHSLVTNNIWYKRNFLLNIKEIKQYIYDAFDEAASISQTIPVSPDIYIPETVDLLKYFINRISDIISGWGKDLDDLLSKKSYYYGIIDEYASSYLTYENPAKSPASDPAPAPTPVELVSISSRQIVMILYSDDEFEVFVDEKPIGVFSFGELGFEDRRVRDQSSNRHTKQWQVLMIVAEHSGDRSYMEKLNAEGINILKDIVKIINQKLKYFFRSKGYQLEYTPFRYSKRAKAYLPSFTFADVRYGKRKFSSRLEI